MIIKEIELNRDRLLMGVSKIAQAVGSTMGPFGRTVLLESENHVGGITVTKDGVTVAKSLVLEDPVENLAVTLFKQAAEKTATTAGDGTTTSIVLAAAIIDCFIAMDKDTTAPELRKVREEAEVVIQNLRDMAIDVTDELLLSVATISANGDSEVGQLVADVFKRVGKDGVVTVERSNTSKTYFEVTNGIRVTRGWSSSYQVTDKKKQEAVLDNPYVLVTDREIQSLQSIEHILAPVVRDNKSLLIIGEMNANALNALNMNVLKGTIKAANIIPPQFGYKRKDLLADIAMALGAKYISDDVGDDFSLVDLSSCGRASRVIVGRDATVIISESDEMARTRIDEIKAVEVSDDDDIRFRQERIATLSGNVGVVYVGASTDIEQKEKYDRVDDAVCATRAALEEGILPGGGYALLKATESLPEDSVLALAASAPFYQIMSNAGIDHDLIEGFCEEFDSKGSCYNVGLSTFGDMIDMGVVDPLKVTRSALENAVSVATTILSTDVIIYNLRENASGK
jgi:chaperonin GroEL